MSESETELKPLSCPFCGGEPEKDTAGRTAISTYWRWLSCSECFAEGPHILASRGDTSDRTDELAIEAWNMRSS